MRRAWNTVFFCLLLLISVAASGATHPTLRFSLPPVLEALPIAFADSWGLFDERGIDVDLIGFSDPDERSAALQTGHVDGLISDVTHAILDESTGIRLVITGAARSQPQSGSQALTLLSPASFRIDTLQQLLASRQLIGVLQRSDYEFMLDQLVEQTDGGDVRTAQYSLFTDILQLATMLGAQWVGSAVLPEPYVSYIATYAPPGAEPLRLVKLSHFDGISLPPALVLFRESYVKDHPDVVRAFLDVYNEAAARLNDMPREELVQTGLKVAVSLFFQAANTDLIGQDVLNAIPIPTFEPLGTLSAEEYGKIADWVIQKGYLYGVPPAYDGFVDWQYLP
jgi:NitT/TauT family transport system substrate-binding protein